MKSTPILFTAEMVRAILEGRKTQTRRVVRLRSKHLVYDLENSTVDGPNQLCDGQYLHVPFRHKDEADEGCREREYCPYGDPGDQLWVKETFMPDPYINATASTIYRATEKDLEMYSGHHWKPSIFMPRIRSRLTLEIKSVRVERLQDITEADAKAEGVEIIASIDHGSTNSVFAYRKLWESINSPGSWKANPWVWVIEFAPLKSNSAEVVAG